MINKIDIKDIILIAKEAGKIVMEIYGQDFKVDHKQDNSPLTQADKKANDFIENGLRKLSVSFPIISEEGKKIPYEKRKCWEYFWLVDPLDGTKEFVSKNGEFTVNIALIFKDTPVLGVVYAPVLDICYWAQQNKGAFKDGKKLPLKTLDQRSTYKIVVSRSHMSNETQKFIDDLDTNKEKELIAIGSSLKICIVAEGEADIYPRLGPTMEWDTAAAHVIVKESKNNLQMYKDGKYLKHVYNKENLLNQWFVVGVGL
jgi:3'(2'), 5'-bisphosphate nucleotidase